METNIDAKYTSWQSGTNSLETSRTIGFSGTTEFLKTLPLAELGTAAVAIVGLKKLVEGFSKEERV